LLNLKTELKPKQLLMMLLTYILTEDSLKFHSQIKNPKEQEHLPLEVNVEAHEVALEEIDQQDLILMVKDSQPLLET